MQVQIFGVGDYPKRYLDETLWLVDEKENIGSLQYINIPEKDDDDRRIVLMDKKPKSKDLHGSHEVFFLVKQVVKLLKDERNKCTKM